MRQHVSPSGSKSLSNASLFLVFVLDHLAGNMIWRHTTNKALWRVLRHHWDHFGMVMRISLQGEHLQMLVGPV